MYHLKELPALPADLRLATPAPREPFIDEAAIHSLIQSHQPQWHEQRYIGEDFAGRDDCLFTCDDSHALPVRHQLGAFFTTVNENPSSKNSVEASPPINLHDGSVSKNRVLAAAAALVILATSLTGLWAAQAFAPAVPKSHQSGPLSHPVSNHPSAENSETAMIVIDKLR